MSTPETVDLRGRSRDRMARRRDEVADRRVRQRHSKRARSAGRRLLYHHTCHLHLPRILAEGITRGDVPTDKVGGFNAPWLTVDPRSGAQGWAGGGGANKTAVRLFVTVPEADERLRRWLDLAADRGVSAEWLHRLDGGTGESGNWFVYEGVIPAEWIERVEILGDPTDLERGLLADSQALADFRIANREYMGSLQKPVA